MLTSHLSLFWGKIIFHKKKDVGEKLILLLKLKLEKGPSTKVDHCAFRGLEDSVLFYFIS
jgi:hypothetical protein